MGNSDEKVGEQKANKNAEERAAKYLDAAKINQEQLWKRRQIEWRTSFGIWTAMAVGAGFVYMNVSRPVPDFLRWPMVVSLTVVYVIAIGFHIRHMKAIFISNEMDLDFIAYNLSRAEWELDPKVQKKPQYPRWVDKERNELWREHYYIDKREKMKHLYTPVGITCLITFLSMFLFITMVVETQATSRQPRENQVCPKIERQTRHCQWEQMGYCQREDMEYYQWKQMKHWQREQWEHRQQAQKKSHQWKQKDKRHFQIKEKRHGCHY